MEKETPPQRAFDLAYKAFKHEKFLLVGSYEEEYFFFVDSPPTMGKDGQPGSKFLFVHLEEKKSVFHNYYMEMENDHNNAEYNFYVGLKYQSYCLCLKNIINWLGTQRILIQLKLNPLDLIVNDRIDGNTSIAEKSSWLDVTEAEAIQLIRNDSFRFEDADLKLFAVDLVAAKYYNCFDYNLHEYSDYVCGKIVLLNQVAVKDIEEEFEEDEYFQSLRDGL